MSSRKTRRFGKYLLLDRIGAGGMAEVYRAKRFGAQGFAKYLAIKRIRPELSQESDFVDMFIDEAKILVNLSHPNIVQVYDFGSVEGDYFISMEFVSGAQLSRLIRSLLEANKRLPLIMSLFIAKEIARGLSYAHSQHDPSGEALGLVHRDISPQNIMISWHGDVKILDFGVARAANKISSSNSGQLKGKFAYMSPEQACGENIDHRTDLFATGILLWEMVAAQRLFKSDSEIKTLKLVQQCEVPPLSQVASPVPDGLDAVMARALAKDPDQRYQSGAEMEQDLTRLLYTVDPGFTPGNLATLMQEEFKEEAEKEKKLMRKYEQRMSRYGMVALVTGTVEDEADADWLEPSDSGLKTVSESGVLKEEPLLSTPTGKGEMLLPMEPTSEPGTHSMVTYRPRRFPSILIGTLAGLVLLGGATAAVWITQSAGEPTGEAEVKASSPGTPEDGPSSAKSSDTADREDGDSAGPGATGGGAGTGTGEPGAAGDGAEDGAKDGADDGTDAVAAEGGGDAVATAAPVKARRKRGKLTINSTPWGRIHINGRDTGKTTPVKGMSVPAGKVRVLIVNPKGLSASRTVTVEAGGSETIIEKLK